MIIQERSKPAMRIGELCKRTGVSVRSIRHYDEAGLLRSSRAENGYRHFPGSEVRRVVRIRFLIHHGFTVEDIRPMAPCLDRSDSEEEFCERVLARYEEKLAEVETQMAEMADRRRQLADRVAALRRRRDTELRLHEVEIDRIHANGHAPPRQRAGHLADIVGQRAVADSKIL